MIFNIYPAHAAILTSHATICDALGHDCTDGPEGRRSMPTADAARLRGPGSITVRKAVLSRAFPAGTCRSCHTFCTKPWSRKPTSTESANTCHRERL